MAQKVIVSLVDDITGGEADETVRFGLDGISYEIDLATKSAEKLRKTLEPFVGASRRTGGRPVKPVKGRRATDGHSAAEIRAWAKSNGQAVPDKGRIPQAVMAAFKEVHGS